MHRTLAWLHLFFCSLPSLPLSAAHDTRHRHHFLPPSPVLFHPRLLCYLTTYLYHMWASSPSLGLLAAIMLISMRCSWRLAGRHAVFELRITVRLSCLIWRWFLVSAAGSRPCLRRMNCSWCVLLCVVCLWYDEEISILWKVLDSDVYMRSVEAMQVAAVTHRRNMAP